MRRFSWADDPFAARAAGEVHVWTWAFGHAGFRGDEEEALRRDITADEGERATRYRNPGAREQFVRSRAALRHLLGASLNCGPCAVEIVPNCDHFYNGCEDRVANLVSSWLARTLKLPSD